MFVRKNFFTMKLIKEQINLDVIKKRHNIWLDSYSSDTMIRTITPILTDKLHRGYSINLIPVINTHVAGTRFFPLIFNQDKRMYYLHEGDWITFSKDDSNQHDPNAVICLTPISNLGKKFIFKNEPTKLILNSEINHTKHALLYGGSKTQLYLPIGYVPLKEAPLVRRCINHYNRYYCPDCYADSNDQIIAQLTGNYNNVVARVKKVTYTGNHCNYYITVYIAQSACTRD